MKVALVHDWLVNRGGAERVVLALHRAWPDAPVYAALYHPAATFPDFGTADVRTSILQRISRSSQGFRAFLPLYPAAFRRIRIDDADVVVASTAGFAHHVRPVRGCLVAYCHTPPRFLWEPSYDVASVAPGPVRALIAPVRAALRRADRSAAARVHAYVANGRPTAERIRAVYGRDAQVVHPPVAVDRFRVGAAAENRYLLVGRLLGHRNFELAVRAFTTMGRELVVVGTGPQERALREAGGPTVRFAGVVDDEELIELYATSRGVIVPEVADLGLVALEANASGRPAIALGIGGALETVVDGVTGVLFGEASSDALIEAVERAESIGWDPAALRRHAQGFSEHVFRERMRAVVEARADCARCAGDR